ncbi:MAG: N-acetylmuramoyl-L-alanine amidase [Lachnospiraceae bacterium]|nr:N-acetylmuramoyl-L-alanine amidase [Lachnospiraceae bacterium]
MSDKCNKSMVWYSIFLGVLAMALMLYYNLNKEIEMKVEPQKVEEPQVEHIGIDGVYDDLYESKNLQKPLTITLPSAEVAQQAVLLEKYSEFCVQLIFEDIPKGYFYDTPLTGDVDGIKDIVCQYQDGKTILSIYLNDVLAHIQKVKDREITLQFKPLRQVYDKVVVIDPGHGGEDAGVMHGDVYEKDITLSVALKLKEMLEKTDIKVLCTRLEDETISNQMRTNLANAVNADLFLNMHCGFDEKNESSHGIATYYNDTFFIPDFGNADFAYIVEEHVVRSISGSSLGVAAGEVDNELLKHSMVPTAWVEMGYVSNENERGLLQQEEYVNKLAYGLYSAIVRSYEQMME